MNGANPASLIHKPASVVERLKPQELFPSRKPLEVELGSGDGSFLVAYAQAHPEVNFIGVERLLGRLRKVERKALRAGLTNVRLLRLEASYVVQWLLPADSTRVFHIYFPDPWPKRRHWKNRLVNDGFPEIARVPLERGGVVCLRTDNQDYFDQMTRVFGAHSHFQAVATPPGLLAFKTDFERGFDARGIPILSATYEKVS